MFTAEEVIDGARAQDPSFSEDRHPPSVCLPFLTWWWRRIAGRIIRIAPDAISDEIVVPLPLADFEAGEALTTELLRVRGGDALLASGETVEVRVVPFGHRHQARYWPACYIRGQTLHLLGRENDWNRFQSVTIHGTAVPPSITDSTDQINLPDLALEAASTALAARLAKRAPDELAGSLQLLQDEADEAQGELLDTLQEKDSATVSIVKEVF